MAEYSDIDMSEIDINTEVGNLTDAVDAGTAEVIDSEDTDGDGLVDFITVDETGDGIIDVVVIDNDGDDIADELHYDTSGDGLTDMAVGDTDGDGVVETVWETPESDTDDTYDTMLVDTDGDGAVDQTYTYDAAADGYLLGDSTPETSANHDTLNSADSF